MKELVTYNAAKLAIAKATRVDDVKSIRDLSIAAKAYAIQAKDREMLENAIEIKDRAEIRVGELLIEMAARKERHSGRGDQKSGLHGATPKLDDLGVTKTQSSRWQAKARLAPEQQEKKRKKAKDVAVASLDGAREIISAAKAEIHQEKRAKRQERERALGNKQVALPERKYGVVYADPEWKFEVWSEKGLTNSSPDNHYSTSDIDEIKGRNISAICADDCILFLWSTVPMQPQALDVLDAWGFEYKTQFCWVKNKAGTGYWLRNKHEILLIGTRGKIPAPAPGDQPASVINADVGRHSQKPEIFYEIIERMFPSLPKIELNLRGEPRPGWDGWGHEAKVAA